MIRQTPAFFWKIALPALALAVGLGLGLMWPRGDFGAGANGGLVAQGQLAEVLARRLAWDQTQSGLPQVNLTFRNRRGEFCRTFFTGVHAGYACQREGAWMIEALVRHQSESANASYRMVGSELPEALRSTIMADMDGEPFNATDEVRARNNGWTGR